MNIWSYLILVIAIVLLILVFISLYKINQILNLKLSEIKDNFTSHLTASQGTVSAITREVTELKSTAQNVLEIGKNIQSLQDILKPPKLRGSLGECFLEQCLAQVMPTKHYQTSYRFQTGSIVDAIVKLKDSKVLCIDAKFPLDSLKEYISNGVKNSSDVPSQFIRDVKKHIDSISAKYILPEEGTLDYALMYIPAENVYYEIILKDEKILQYAKEKHVIPVSPLSLYLYLSTILTGLKGMEIEKSAKLILGKIGNIRVGLDNYISEFNTLGMHLANAKSKYDSSREILLKISEKFKDIELLEHSRNE